MEQIHVFGHKNPDTDSICATICYANFKNVTNSGTYTYIPNRLGDLNSETAFVLDYFNVETPAFLQDIDTKLEDLNLYNPVKVSKDDPVKKALNILQNTNGSRIVPIVDEKGVLEGVISMGDITRLFVDTSEENITLKYEILFDNFLDLLEGEVKYGKYKYKKVEGKIIIGTIENVNTIYTDKDIIVTTRLSTARHYLENNSSGCIILASNVDVSSLEGINDNIAVVTVNKSIFNIVTLINQSVSVSSVMNTGELLMFSNNSSIDDAKNVMKSSLHRNFPVIGKNNEFLGLVSRRHLIEYPRKKAILVDHNEESQSIYGIRESEIVEIIDHHRVADIQTDKPLYIRAEPLGSTCTIIYKMYIENHVPIEKNIAGLLMSAIISDTLIFNSPTCTEYDKYAAKELAKIADVSIEEYAKKMFNAGTKIDDVPFIDIISSDSKPFNLAGITSYVSQMNTLDFESVKHRSDECMEAMNEFCQEKGIDLLVLMVTDIIRAGSYILCVGDQKEIAEKAFGIPAGANGIFLEGVVSRKKQIVPKLMNVSRNISV